MSSQETPNGPAALAGLSPAKRALLERRLRQRQAAEVAPAEIPRRADRETAPLSFAQERLWLLDQIVPERTAYNVPRALRLAGELRPEALQPALDALVARHAILRTIYRAENGSPIQVVSPARPVKLEVVDLRGLGGAEREAEARRRLEQEARRPFDLARDLMLRAHWIRLAEREHVLCLVTHHIASDGWSKGILFGELAAFYNARATGVPPTLGDLPIQYGDFAAWQREAFEGDRLRPQVDYWKNRLAGAPALLELPTDRPRPAVPTYGGASARPRISKTLLEALKALSRCEGASLFMTLLAAFKTLLYRYSGCEDIVVGTPISGRKLLQVEPLIGDFVNMLAVRTDLSGNPPFRELLRRVRAAALDAFEHSDLPFEKLVAELQPARALSYSPIFQVMFSLENAAAALPPFLGLTVTPIELTTGTAKHDLIFGLVEGPDGLSGELEYATDLLDPATAERLLSHWEVLLGGIVGEPGRRLVDLPLLSEGERRQVVVEWNATQRAGPAVCVQELFEAQVDRSPGAVALVAGTESLSYRQLDERANRLAHHLRRLGVGPETPVGLYVERSAAMVVGLLGVLKAGGPYVPLDPAFPAERLAYMLADSAVPVILTERKLVGALPANRARLVVVDEGAFAAEPADRPHRSAGPENLAYVIYTSGSTGKPKGVMVRHAAVANFLRSMAERPGLAAGDTLVAVTTLSFDIAALELLLPLVTGARLVVASRETASDGAMLAREMARHAATAVQATPATWRMLLTAGWAGDPAIKILCGGEALPRELAEELVARGEEVWNLYGPTETTIWSAAHRVGAGAGPVPIGRPIANTQIYILDRALRPTPVGVPGELYIGGEGLARGYHARPELTAERFLPDPFGKEPGGRLYRTGDLARWRADGLLECLGRTDFQVKLRGFRIELGEIESALAQHPTVRQAVALAREESGGDKRLVAYVVPPDGTIPEPAALRGYLRERLPEYMVPSTVVVLGALPLTPNGKVDRRALPAPEGGSSAANRPFVAPRTPVEETLAAIWGKALGLEKVSALDNFFDLGGHSLLAAQIVAQVRDAFRVDLPMRSLFEAATLGEFGEMVETALLEAEDPEAMEQLLAEVEGAGS